MFAYNERIAMTYVLDIQHEPKYMLFELGRDPH